MTTSGDKCLKWRIKFRRDKTKTLKHQYKTKHKPKYVSPLHQNN